MSSKNENSWKCASPKKASIQGEKVVLAKCQKALIGGTVLLPTSALGRPRSSIYIRIFLTGCKQHAGVHPVTKIDADQESVRDVHQIFRLNKLVAACSDIRVNKEMRSIEVTSNYYYNYYYYFYHYINF